MKTRSNGAIPIGARILISCVCCLLAIPTQAEVGDPAQYIEVQPADALNGLVLSPSTPAPVPASINTITVRNSDNEPIAFAPVWVQFGSGITTCGDAVHETTTDADGVAVITLTGGGCIEDVQLAGLIKVSGVTIRSYSNVKSPDFDGAAGDLYVSIADLVPFSNEFLDFSPAGCHDYDSDGETDLSDLIIMATPFSWGNQCPR